MQEFSFSAAIPPNLAGDRSTFIVENVTRQCTLATLVHAAQNSTERRRGLLQMTDGHSDFGLWINPCEAIHTFGMRVDLDIIFLDAILRVKKIRPELKPSRIAFCLAATSVLEIRSGLAAATNLTCGDQLRLCRPAGSIEANSFRR